MALVAASAEPLNPEVGLAQALHEYESILSTEDRVELHSQGMPDATAAINLTVLIDKKCNSDRRQCMGPRLITFLESIQQFSRIVDVFVSSHPEVAALVWGGVKLTLLAANNFSSYFDQLSTLLMNIGRECPRMHDMGCLYPSTGLQKALCEYYASIIRLCKKITQSLRKPVYIQLSKALLVSFKAEFGPYQEEIVLCSEAVRDQSILASMQAQKLEIELQAKERMKNIESRKVLAKISRKFKQTDEETKKWHLEINYRRLERMKWDAMDWLSTYDYQLSYRQIRKECVPGTSLWICKTPEFLAWTTGKSQNLWCTGRFAHLIENITLDTITSYFFCRFDDQDSLKAKTIIGSIVRQMVNDLPSTAFREFNRERANGTALIGFLEKALDHTRQYFIVLDGLDECGDSQIREIAEIFQGLLRSPYLCVKMFWTSRPNANTWLIEKIPNPQRITLESIENQDKVAGDIRRYVRNTLEGWLEGEMPKLRINDPALILTILNSLEHNAQGMFLWVKFQLQSLCEKKSDTQIIHALKHLPRDLPHTFERILSQFKEIDDIDIGRQIFRWATVAKRPLTLDELREAISTQPLQEEWDAQTSINDMGKAVACCGNLVFVDEEQQTIHFTHSSVRQYLISEAVKESLAHYYIDMEKADTHAGCICVTYLNFSTFKKQVARTPRKNLNTSDFTSTIVRNSLSAGNTVNKIALHFLRHDDRSNNSVQRLLEEAKGDIEQYHKQNILKQYALQSYAELFWLEHTKQDISHDSKLWKLWCNLIAEASWRNTLSGTSWTVEDWNNRSANVFQWAVENIHYSLLQLILTSEVKPTQDKLLILVEGAASKGHLRFLEICLHSGNISPSTLGTALRSGARGGYLAVVNRLLQENANVNAVTEDDHSRTALQEVSEGVHPVMVERLRQELAEHYANTKPKCRTALQAAAQGGHLSVVERLLQDNADVNAAADEYNGRTALQAAAENGHLTVVEILLDGHADVDAPAAKYSGRTALQAAEKGDHHAVIERLHVAGAK